MQPASFPGGLSQEGNSIANLLKLSGKPFFFPFYWQVFITQKCLFQQSSRSCIHYYQCSEQKPNQPLGLHWRVLSNGTMPWKQLQITAGENRQLLLNSRIQTQRPHRLTCTQILNTLAFPSLVKSFAVWWMPVQINSYCFAPHNTALH